MVFGFNCAYSQGIPTYPIPSYNVKVNSYANFREKNTGPNSKDTKERRRVYVQIKSVSGTRGCQATVWIYSLDYTTVLGPFTVACGETHSEDIDEREWGVLVESEDEIIVNVWISSAKTLKLQGFNHKSDPAIMPKKMIPDCFAKLE